MSCLKCEKCIYISFNCAAIIWASITHFGVADTARSQHMCVVISIRKKKKRKRRRFLEGKKKKKKKMDLAIS